MKILYIYRSNMSGYSIGKVFRSIENEMRKYADVDSFYLPIASASPLALLKNIKAAYHAANAKHYDIIHITGSEHYLIPFLKIRHNVVVTVHDLYFFSNNPNPIKSFFLYVLWIKSLELASRITCISDTTKKEVLKLIKYPIRNILTIHNPIGNDFVFKRKVLNKDCPIILHIGTKKNKNLLNTIIALRNLKHHLRIIGKLDKEDLKLLNQYNINYSNSYNLSDSEIVYEYEQCDFVNFPSLYEGFGMPILEGQAVGRVVITSNISPMKDIAGNGAILVEPNNPNSILDGYKKGIAHYNKYVLIGLNNVQKYKIANVSKEYLKVYQELLIK